MMTNGDRVPTIDDALIERLAGTERLLVATDFDGVLAPIVDDPGASAPIADAVESLARLGRDEATAVAIVSGRERGQLQAMVPEPERFILVGSHGADLDESEPTDEERRRLDRLVADLEAVAAETPGFHIEPKALSVAVHFRRVADDRRDEAIEAVDRLRRAWPAKVVTGKEVVEFTIGVADKGDALRTLRHRSAATVAVYLGDDVTDEDAFAALAPGDVGVKVGPGPTSATHRVESPEAVTDFLAGLADRRCRPDR